MKTPVNFRLSTMAIRLLDVMAKQNGLSRTAMIELLIRETARVRGIVENEDDNALSE